MKNSINDQFDINLINIKKDVEYFDYQVDKEFFENFDQDIVSNGNINVNLKVIKTDLMITMKFNFAGNIILTCDKSLKQFEEPVQVSKTIFFKYGEENLEMDENLYQIAGNTININVSSHIMEFLILEIPFRKIHPELRDEMEEKEDEELIYQTNKDQNIKEKPDPRWSDLEKLKNKFK